MGVLDDIIVGVRQDLAPRMAATPLADLEARLGEVAPPLDPMPAFRAPGLAVISEVKRKSPSKGELADIPDPAELAASYAAGGAAAISVLTEQRRFGGSLADLAAVRARVDIPVLRKEFIVTDYQVVEARAHGADLVLLIVAALDDAELRRLHDLSLELGLRPLVEVHTADEARRAVDLGAELIGVNNRNLQTLDVDLAQFSSLVELLPDDCVNVAESGITGPADAARLYDEGAQVLLVGETLVRHPDPTTAVQALLRSIPE
ncbi:indole-3-glycerol phosphate synthase TrpC [Propionibacteriaceae bacterium Y1923]|uniref:indole-3-glycerol phosphate synthase TrpC n=1 Tax=Aestuariimicrobium sp. Y1814 TaxID=3418742 RepID=UPI003C1E899A